MDRIPRNYAKLFLKNKAKEICTVLQPIAVIIKVVDSSRDVTVSIKCEEKIERLMKQ